MEKEEIREARTTHRNIRKKPTKPWSENWHGRTGVDGKTLIQETERLKDPGKERKMISNWFLGK
jgi:hypothetical protein